MRDMSEPMFLPVQVISPVGPKPMAPAAASGTRIEIALPDKIMLYIDDRDTICAWTRKSGTSSGDAEKAPLIAEQERDNYLMGSEWRLRLEILRVSKRF
jgi:hypothetical protein